MQGTVWQVQQNFNPRPPRGGRPASHPSKDNIFEFQSTPSARRATKHQLSKSSRRHISIHALREEGDRKNRCAAASGCKNFNPRPPRGGRLCFDVCIKFFFLISIHALREEGDVICFYWCVAHHRFQSTPSARRATGMSLPTSLALRISIHALREEGDLSSSL